MTPREELMEVSDEELEELVRESKADEASRINGYGRAAQIAYLLDEEEEPLLLRKKYEMRWTTDFSKEVREVYEAGESTISINGDDFHISEPHLVDPSLVEPS